MNRSRCRLEYGFERYQGTMLAVGRGSPRQGQGGTGQCPPISTPSDISNSDLFVRQGGSVAEWLACWTQAQGGLQIAAAMLSGNSLRQTVHTHRASVHQANSASSQFTVQFMITLKIRGPTPRYYRNKSPRSHGITVKLVPIPAVLP